MNEKFFKDIKKRLIDLDKSFNWLAKEAGYSSPWGLRSALRKNTKKAVTRVEEILEISAE